MTYSFDIFDTCLVRKCGTPENMLDVLSLRVFKEPVEEWVRQEFVVARKTAQDKVWEENPFISIVDIYNAMDFRCPQLKEKEELIQIEKNLEKELLVPVLEMRERINKLRSKGNHIIYISDMYLSDELIRNKMSEYDFLKGNDTLYVSGTIGKLKQDGSLFEYVRIKERLSYRNWKHIGDSKHNDYTIPRKLGIKAELVNWGYNPYPNNWRKNDYSLGFKYPSIIAGLNRALSLCNDENTHRDFVLDIIAPFYCSWVYQILKDANRKGIKRLYFCARDAYQIYKIALRMQYLFPKIEIKYIYVSRKALYKEDNDNAKISYFIQEGLASKSDEIAIVDTTTSGKTLQYLNSYLEQKGYRTVRGYYYLLWTKIEGVERNPLKVKLYDAYVKQNQTATRLVSNLYIYENFFALNNEPKTIDYIISNNKVSLMQTYELNEDDVKLNHLKEWVIIHENLLSQYVDCFMQMSIYEYANNIFDTIAMPTMMQFFMYPKKAYLKALEDFYAFNWKTNSYVPYVGKLSLFNLIRFQRRNNLWRRATIINSLPKWFSDFLCVFYLRK